MQTDGRDGPARTAHHRVPSAYFDDLAAGRGGPDLIRFLRGTEYSRRLLLLRALLDAAAATPGALGPLPPVDSAWEALTAAQERAPEAFRELLLHPQTGIWLGHGLRRLHGTAWGEGPLWTDLGHLHAVCAVAALRAAVPLRTTVPLRDGTAMFPTLGLARLPDRPRWGTAEVVVAGGRLRVDPYGASVGPPGPPAPPDGAGTDGAALDGIATDGAGLDGDATDGTAPDGAGTDGGALEGAGTDGAALDGAATDGTAPDRDATDGTAPDGTATDGTAHDGTATDGTAPDGTAPDGTAPDRDATDGTAHDGTAPDRDATYGTASDADAPGWQVLRRLRVVVAGRDLEVFLDDIDPYRDLSEPLPAARLGEDRAADWQERFGRAMDLLAGSDPEMAAALGEGLRTLTAVRPRKPGVVLSASSGDAFGGVLTSLPPDPATFAVTLVHEFQHTKLGALLHLLTLEEDAGAERHYAPWRDDPRPLSGLLQGAYAFLGVTEFWSRYLDRVPGPQRAYVEFEFALSRGQTGDAVRTLLADPALTGHGRRFVGGMAARLADWRADPRIGQDRALLAEFAATDHRTGWRIRHLSPAPDDVRALARAFMAGARADCRLAPSAVVPDLAAPWSHARAGLIRRCLTAGSRPAAHGSAADRALLARDPTAVAACAELLVDEPESADAWTGLVLALGAGSATGRLLRRPELARAVHRELRLAGTAADPLRVARWLAAGTGER
ncbi:HEXXH motif domain-containing protein [Streptomyces sp. LP11]|uniref:HEXXH motif domain-containing protein n=1 Tax=Streptomyces pyxinicus TaxID=2970331 RepID=A0ABT2AYY5_9ACTN|nr:HEXXH motif domain-containing protein [Streptomyces sp. LP11]MCS0601370.1 HEXXH motif domain-containing protein [Streptomyces sp. LP11]